MTEDTYKVAVWADGCECNLELDNFEEMLASCSDDYLIEERSFEREKE